MLDLKFLLMFFMVISTMALFISGYSWINNKKNPIFRWNFLFWVFSLVNFLIQGATQNQTPLIQSLGNLNWFFLTYFVIRIHHYNQNRDFNYKYYWMLAPLSFILI